MTSKIERFIHNLESQKIESAYYERLEAKKAKNKMKSNALKLILNSAFGKLADKWSGLYDPQMMLEVTLTGQLLLIELIARLTNSGAKVVYANTDGVAVQGNYDTNIVRQWEKDYNLVMEEEKFDEFFIRDVNNLFAIHDDKIVKRSQFLLFTKYTKKTEKYIFIRTI